MTDIDPRLEDEQEEFRYHGELCRLDICGIIQDSIKFTGGLAVGELVSHEDVITMDFYTPGGGNFIVTVNISRYDNPDACAMGPHE